MANSSIATILEVGGLTAGEITYSVLRESWIQQKRVGAEADEERQKP